MFPTSTHKGQSVMGFPDVCKTPTPPPQVPIAYPNIGKSTTGVKSPIGVKTPVATKTAVTKTSGDVAALKSHLGILHQKIMSMPGGNTTSWHATIDDYVMTSAELYKLLSE